MSWLKLDDKLPRNSKILALQSADSAWLYICALSHCAESLTDGFIADSMVPILAPHIDDCDGAVARCVQVGLMQRAEGGYLIPDYIDYNPSREKVLADREAAAERKRRSRRTSQRDDPPQSQPESHRDSHVTDTESHNGSHRGSHRGSHTHPVPSRPSNSPPSSSTVTRTAAPKNAEEEDDQQSKPVDNPTEDIRGVARVIAEHKLANRKGPPVADTSRWLARVTTTTLDENRDQIAELLERHPDDPTPIIAARILGTHTEPPATRDRSCETCHGVGLDLDLDGTAHPCPTCTPQKATA